VRIFLAIGLLIAGVVASGAIVASGGSGGAAPARPATAAVAPPPAPPEPSRQSAARAAEAEVRARYAAYRAAQPTVEASRADRRPQLLRRFLAEPARSRVLAGLAALHAAGRRSYGSPASKVFAVAVRGDRAVLHDCRDERSAGQLDVATGRRLTVGVEHTHVVVRFARVDGRWLISGFELGDQPCR
jgi:hypothetical protein